MKTLFLTILIAVLAVGLLLALTPSKADAWYRGPAVGFSLVLPPFGLSIGAPHYYPGPVYAAAPYPFYGALTMRRITGRIIGRIMVMARTSGTVIGSMEAGEEIGTIEAGEG